MVVDEAARFAEWTKESRGEMPPPEAPLANDVCELFKSGDIVVSSIVTNATVNSKADLRELWSAVWTDVDVLRQAAGAVRSQCRPPVGSGTFCGRSSQVHCMMEQDFALQQGLQGEELLLPRHREETFLAFLTFCFRDAGRARSMGKRKT